MTDNIYAPPTAEVEGAVDADGGAMFYVVGRTKFIVLYLLTFSYYGLYWHYKNWALYKQSLDVPLIPVLRSIFQVFFTHSLFGEMDAALKNKNRDFSWSPALLATGYVFLLIFGSVAGNLLGRYGPEMGITPGTLLLTSSVLTFSTLIFQLLILGKAQKAANLASGDAMGESNNQFTWANWIWIAFGVLGWLIGIVGFVALLAPGLFAGPV